MISAKDVKKDENLITFINPLSSEVSVEIFEEPNNTKKTYILNPFEVQVYPKWLADILTKHIIDAMLNEQKVKVGTEQLREAAFKQITEI